jgi:hypothetical protein
MLDSMLSQLETDLHVALNSCVAEILSTARTQLEDAIAEIEKERSKGLAIVEEQRAKAVAFVGNKQAELQREIDAMYKHQEAQEGCVKLNVGGHRFETSVQTLRRVPGSLFDAYFSGRYAQGTCKDGCIFIDRDGALFDHVLEFLRDDVLAVAEDGERPSVGLLRRLKREFSFFSIMPKQRGKQSNVELFDTLIAAAKHSEDGEDKEDEEDEEDKTGEENEEEKEEKESDDEKNVRRNERIQECTSRNRARREAEGDSATTKWCNRCFEDKTFDNFRKHCKGIFGLAQSCKACTDKAPSLTDERIQECTSRNQARREAEGDSATTKWCNRCFEDKTFVYFSNKRKGIFGLGQTCKACTDKAPSLTDGRIQECTSRNQARREAEGDSATSKWCNRCFEDKTFDEFNKERSCIFGFTPSCRVCIKAGLLNREALASGGGKML